MSAIDWILYLALAALLAGVAIALYARREPGGRRRFLPAGLRAAALALGLLLVFDPWMPGFAAGAADRTVVLLDDSWSMNLPAARDSTRWAAALARVRALGVERVALLSGGSAEVDDLDRLEPRAADSRIAPSLRAAVESGARRMILVSDGAVTDAEEATRLLAGVGAGLRVVPVGAAREVANAAVAAVDAPRFARAGDTLRVRVDVAALGLEGESLLVTLELDGGVVAEVGLAAPADGRLASVDPLFRVPEARSGGALALRARVRRAGAGAADDYPADDARPFLLDVEERPRGIVLVSLLPDWEPRFLLPVLERASGLPVRGYIRAPAGGYLTMGTGAAAARRVAEADVRADLQNAAVAVLHGVGRDAPPWLRSALAHERLLLFPGGGTLPDGLSGAIAAAVGGPVDVGDWYVDERPPASPVASLLAGADLAELPPLLALRAADAPTGTWTPLAARRDRRGAARAVVLAGSAGAQRWAVATGTGYWRWSLRGGEARRAYALLWASLIGWLTEDLGASGAPIRPDPRVVERGAPIVWRVAGEADSLDLRLEAEHGSVRDTMLAIAADRTARSASMEPGNVRWQATAGELDAAGELAVAAWSPEFVRPARDLSSLSAVAATIDAGDGARRRLHASPLPWLLLVALLCGEWVARRQAGLR